MADMGYRAQVTAHLPASIVSARRTGVIASFVLLKEAKLELLCHSCYSVTASCSAFNKSTDISYRVATSYLVPVKQIQLSMMMNRSYRSTPQCTAVHRSVL